MIKNIIPESLFLRMRFVHFVGMFLLVANGIFFTDNLIGSIVQYVVAAVILVHDLDEKKNGVDAANAMIKSLSNLKKDTRVELNHTFSKEYQTLAVLINQFLDKLSCSLDIAEDIKNAKELSHTMSELSAQVAKHAQESQKALVGSLENLKNTLEGSHQNELFAKESNSSISQADEILDKTKNLLLEFSQKIDKKSEHEHELNAKLQELSQQSQEVKGILNIISDIAEQTNLLALNAAIEAARAGEHGRGFAVVADEVRQLAERTQKSLADINMTINIIVQGINNVGAQMGEGMQEFEKLTHTTLEVNESIDNTITQIQSASDISVQSSQESTKMENSLKDMEKQFEKINKNTQKNSEDISHIATLSSEVSKSVEQLERKISSV